MGQVDLSKEHWKDIREYEGRYMISNFGRVKSLPKYNISHERVLKQYVQTGGYCVVYLRNDCKRKKHFVHKLVANAFICNEFDTRCVNHMDGNKLNNDIDNLEWCTHKYNTIHAHETGLVKHKLTYDEIEMIRMLDGCLTVYEIGALYGISYSYVSQINNNERMAHSKRRTFI